MVFGSFFSRPLYRGVLGDFEGYDVSGINCAVWNTDFQIGVDVGGSSA